MYIYFLVFFYAIINCASAVRELQDRIDSIIAHHPEIHIGCKIVSLKNGNILYSHNAQQLFTPASNTKICTALFALEYLGPDFEFVTNLYIDGTIINNTLHGNVYLKTSGNPAFASQDLALLISGLSKKNIKKITGNFYIDTTAFDAEWYPPGSILDNIGYSWNAPILSFIMNNKPCILKSTKIHPKNKSKEFIYANDLIAQLFKKKSIILKGNFLLKKVPHNAQLATRHASQPLAELLVKMMKESDNIYADCFFKTVSHIVTNASGTWKQSRDLLKNFFNDAFNFSETNIRILDGSGRCRYNLISPNQMITLLTWAYKQPYASDFINAFPINGIDGTLKDRMGAAPGCIQAKTGTLNSVSGLSGYINLPNDTLAFCILINGFIPQDMANPSCKIDIEDAVCMEIINAFVD